MCIDVQGLGEGTLRASGNKAHGGFTLIELSIVLVIIGLIVGGVLVGQDLIRAAYVRAQISQIEKFNTAVNTFYGKYQALPGDLNNSVAQMYGFAARGQYRGEGDGNGIIEGVSCDASGCYDGTEEGGGETVMFWVDLSSPVAGNLIEGGFNTAIPTGLPITNDDITGTAVNHFLPVAKIGNGNYVYVYSSIMQGGIGPGSTGIAGINYFGLSAVTGILVDSDAAAGWMSSQTNITVKQAYDIDKKIDDGYPTTGRVIIQYPAMSGMFLATINGSNCNVKYSDCTAALAASATTCADNDNGNGTWNYSLSQNNGAGGNCALSFLFQGGD